MWKRAPTPGATRRIDLSTLRDVRIELARVYRSMVAGEIQTAEGTKLAYVLGRIADIIAEADLEKRIAELEERQERLLQGAPPALPKPS
jgi:hypothetical protein